MISEKSAGGGECTEAQISFRTSGRRKRRYCRSLPVRALASSRTAGGGGVSPGLRRDPTEFSESVKPRPAVRCTQYCLTVLPLHQSVRRREASSLLS